VVLPVLARDGACFAQLRALNARSGQPKYLNVHHSLASNPRMAAIATTGMMPGGRPRPEILITEGMFDGLAASAAGFRSVAFLSAGYPDPSSAVALARLPGPLVVAFDPDPPGQRGATRLVQLLAAQRREAAILRLSTGDLNACAATSADWSVELAARVEHATYPLSHLPSALVLGPGA
jgi:DNA primase